MNNLSFQDVLRLILWGIGGFMIGFGITLLVLSLVGCSPPQQTPAEPPKVTITVTNSRDTTFYGVISGGLFFKTVEVAPNSSSSFWGYKSMVPDSLTLTVTEKPAPARRR